MRFHLKIHRAWVILFVMMFLYSGTVGIVLNCIGVLFSAILEDLGFRAGDLSLFHTIRLLSSSVAMTFTVKCFFKYNTRVVWTILAALFCGGISLMGFFTELWQWYISAVLVGVGTSCIMVVGPMVLNNWFRKNNGLAIGLTAAAAGMTGAVFSPVLSQLITLFGWRLAAVIMGLVSFLLVVPVAVFLLIPSPEKVGLAPYGAQESRNANRGRYKPTTAPDKFIFVLCLVSLLFAANMVNFVTQMPTFAFSIGYALEVGAILTSCCMVGNLIGKLIFGIIVDHIGVYTADRIYVAIIFVALLDFLFLGSNQMVLYLAAVLLGACYAVSNVSISLVFLDLYGKDAYGQHLSHAQAISGIISALLASAIPYLYDITGSFDLAFVCGIVTMVISFFIYTYLCRYSQKRAEFRCCLTPEEWKAVPSNSGSNR